MRLIENSAARNIFNNLKESESIPSMKDENFNETVLRDFRLFLMDKYGDELYKDVTDEDVNEYFTGMFYDIWDNDDLDSANAAEDIIRAEYHISDKSDYYDDYEYDDGDTNWDAEEEADALERFENRYMGGGNGASFNESSKFLKEALDSSIDSIVDDVLLGNEVYVRLDEKDYSSEEGSNIYKIEYSYSIERPEDYDNGYNSGWDRGQDEEFDKKQDERFEKATKAYEEGEVFEFNCVKIEDGKIQYTGFCLLKCFGIEELRHNLEYYKAKRIGVKTISSFEDLTEGVNKFTESANDRYQVREFDGPGAKFGVYDTKQKKFIQKGSKKVMIAGCDELNKKANLKEDSKIWSNTSTEDYYSNLSREEMIQEIKDNGWDEEEINGKPILDADDDELREFLTPYDIDLDYEDYENSILPMIENQCYGDYIVLTGIAANWRGKGEACKAIELSELKEYLMPSYDSHTVLYCDNQDNLYYTEATHDTPMGGTQMYLYGFYDETAYNNAEKELQKLFDDEDFDMYYFCDYLGYKEAEALIKLGLLNPIKRDPHYVGRVDEGHKLTIDNHEELKEEKQEPNCVIFYLNGKELGGHDLKNEFDGERESAKELFAYENKVKPEDIEERLEYRESMNESVKSKKSAKKQPKENKRVIMQQGNVTCFKENDNTYYVFENENDNEVEHDSEESAMHDFLERVGIDANAELKEK